MKNELRALSPKEALIYYPALGTLGHLANLRSAKRGPRFFKVGKSVVYRPKDLETYLFKQPIQTKDSIEVGHD